MSIKLYDYQEAAINKMSNGCILCGGVGSGKSMTSLAYYFKTQGVDIYKSLGKNKKIKNLIIITTARKRDTYEWDGECSRFLMSQDKELNQYDNELKIDSWNNICKYSNLTGCFFIFDEQRVVGKGAWVKAFLKIAKNNDWILLSATPGDTWSDYIPVFLANGFYKNKTEFYQEHCIFSRYTNFPKIERYVGTGRLIRLRNKILVEMDYERATEVHHKDIVCDYDIFAYKELMKNRWNKEKDEPIATAAELCYELRKISNCSQHRIDVTKKLILERKRVIIFYNFDYELDILRTICEDTGYPYAEWNGHKHQPFPDTECWIYLVQYNAGAEGWNCIKTDTIIFFSQNYSYKIMVQASGRIDRLNTPFKDLYYYHLKSRSSIDLAISKALSDKKKFNETKFVHS